MVNPHGCTKVAKKRARDARYSSSPTSRITPFAGQVGKNERHLIPKRAIDNRLAATRAPLSAQTPRSW